MRVLKRFFTGQSPRGYALVQLCGEFDVNMVAELQSTLAGALDPGRFVFADLSQVTFLSSACLTELTVYQQIHTGRLLLCRPSPQVGLSVDASGLGDWLVFHPGEKSALRSIVRSGAGTPRPEPVPDLLEESGG